LGKNNDYITRQKFPTNQLIGWSIKLYNIGFETFFKAATIITYTMLLIMLATLITVSHSGGILNPDVKTPLVLAA